MRFPSARKLVQIYAFLMGVCLVAAFASGSIARIRTFDPVSSPWVGSSGTEFATTLSYIGPTASRVVGAPTGRPYYYGPIEPGECLPPIDVVAFEPHFAFHRFGARLHFGVERDLRFVALRTEKRMPDKLSRRFTYVQVCFPSGIDVEQALVISAKNAGDTGSPFFGGPRLVPPPLRREPAPIQFDLRSNPGGVLKVNGRSVFSTVGRELQVGLAEERGIVVELGEFEDDWSFVARETLRSDRGEHARFEATARWPYFRILFPDGASGGRVALVTRSPQDRGAS